MQLQTLNDQEIIMTMIAIALLLTGAYSMGKVFEYFKAPKVVGEIVGGMLFGGSCLYYLAPTWMSGIFNAYPEQGKVLNIFYQLGLIFLMFSSGFNTKIEIGKKNIKTFSLLFVGATIIPMFFALFAIPFFKESFMGSANNSVAFAIIFSISIAITSIPVISKIFFDMGIMNTKFSNLVLTVSTFQDLCLWILLNAAINMVTTGKVSIFNFSCVAVITIGLFVGTNLVTKRLQLIKINIKSNDFFSISFIFLFATIGILSMLKINLMYSAFLVGYIIKSITMFNEELSQKVTTIADFSFSFFCTYLFCFSRDSTKYYPSFFIIQIYVLFHYCFFIRSNRNYSCFVI